MAAVPTIGRASGVERSPTAPEADATRALYERYSRQILNYCVHQLNSREEAEDAVQTTFMNAFRGLKRGIVPEAEQAWLFKIAENVCLSRRRSSWRRGKVESPNDFEVLQEIVPSKHANRADELIGLEDALAAMPENQRRAILLREWQGLSYREIAAELELSQAAVETLIFRARRSLASGLESPVTPKKRRRISAAFDGVSLGSAIASIKTLLTGGAAIKAVAVAVAAGSATIAATQAEPALVHHMRHQSPPPARTVHVTKQSQATFSSQATVVARASGLTVAQAHAKTHGLAPTHHGAARFGQKPTDVTRRAQTPPLVPVAPAPVVPAAPSTPAPEAPIAAAPVTPAATPTEQPKTEQPKTEQPKTEPTKNGDGSHGNNGNNGKGNDSGAKVETPKADTPKADTPKTDSPKADTPKADTPKTDSPKADTPKAGNNGNGNGNKRNENGSNDKPKVETPRALFAPAADASQAPVAATPAPPAPAAVVTPAAPAAAVTTAPAAPVTTAPAAPVTTASPASTPTHGNGNGGDHAKDNGGDKGKGKGK